MASYRSHLRNVSRHYLSWSWRRDFCENAYSVWASYSGGLIVRGHFVGRRTRSDELVLAYAQLHRDGELKTGSSVLRVARHEHGLRLTQAYGWADGSKGENVLVSVDQPR